MSHRGSVPIPALPTTKSPAAKEETRTDSAAGTSRVSPTFLVAGVTCSA